MSTFGEIVEPVSRNLWEDWDDSSHGHNLVKLEWLKKTEVPQEVKCFTIFEGKYMSDYIKMQSHNLELINSVSDIGMQLYKVDTHTRYICTIRDYNVVQSSKIIELLKDYLLISKEVIAVQTKPLPEYHTMTPAQDCIIRTVATTKPSSKPEFKYPKLEQPNIISGVSAGVICWREHMNLSGIAIVCYIEHPGDYQINKIQQLFEKFNLSQNVNSQPSSALNSNLYI